MCSLRLLHCSVYFEAVTWADLSNGFETVPGGEAYKNRSVLSYHFYEPPQVLILVISMYTVDMYNKHCIMIHKSDTKTLSKRSYVFSDT